MKATPFATPVNIGVRRRRELHRQKKQRTPWSVTVGESGFRLIQSETLGGQTMKPVSFPVWIFVNEDKRTDEGFPYYLWLRGGEPTPLPPAVPIFSTEQIARQLNPGWPFKMFELDSDTFYEVLNSCHDVEDVVLDMGTDNAVLYRVEELLVRFGPET